MNPNLKYAEMFRGKNNGSAQGIMAGVNLPEVIDAVGLIQNSQTWTKQDQRGMELWFSEYLDWVLNSNYGKDEGQKINNHGTYYNVQVSSIALFLNRTDISHASHSSKLTNYDDLPPQFILESQFLV